MNGITIILWATIFIIGVIAIISVKLHYRGAELEKDERPLISKESIDKLISSGRDKITQSDKNSRPTLNSKNIQNYSDDDYEIYPVEEEAEAESYQNIEYESPNQVLINYENEVKKFQEPMTQNQIDIMTSNNDQNNEKTELKDLFTIDELIKESKRKDSEREKESQRINNEPEDTTEIKESIIKKHEAEEKLVEDALAEDETAEAPNEEKVETIQDIIDSTESKEETIQDIINSAEAENESVEETKEETIQDIIENAEEESAEVDEPAESEVAEPTTQKEIAEAINTASQEIEEEKEEEIGFSESDGITDALLNSEEEDEIKQPTLKSPTKIDEGKQDEFGAPVDDSNLLTPKHEENDLDYRKDLAKITNTIRGSRLFQDVKEKLRPESEQSAPISDLEESYIRNVNDYDEYEPIINETHDEFGEIFEPEYSEDAIREENTRKLMNNVAKAPEPEIAKPIIETIKPKPARENIKITIGNADMVLKKGDEIIFRYAGETYSSQVYAINGDDISVRYRRKDITIKPEDVKKIY